jgi:hypothetical protein
MQYRSIAAVAALLLVTACGAHGAEPPPTIGQRTLDDEPTMIEAAAGARAPKVESSAPVCGHPDDKIGVCLISADGVTLQARRLPPGAIASFTLDGDYASPPMGCRPRWVRKATVDAGGVATVRFDIPATDRCQLLASMVARVFVDPGDVERGPVRFGTNPPP